MTNLLLFPLHRWHGADPDKVLALAEQEGMDVDEALAFADEIATGLDRKMRRMSLSCDQRREALDDWHGLLQAGLICLAPGPRRDAD